MTLLLPATPRPLCLFVHSWQGGDGARWEFGLFQQSAERGREVAEPVGLPVCACSALWVPHPHHWEPAEVLVLLSGLCHPPMFWHCCPGLCAPSSPGMGLSFGFVLRKPRMPCPGPGTCDIPPLWP